MKFVIPPVVLLWILLASYVVARRSTGSRNNYVARQNLAMNHLLTIDDMECYKPETPGYPPFLAFLIRDLAEVGCPNSARLTGRYLKREIKKGDVVMRQDVMHDETIRALSGGRIFQFDTGVSAVIHNLDAGDVVTLTVKPGEQNQPGAEVKITPGASSDKTSEKVTASVNKAEDAASRKLAAQKTADEKKRTSAAPPLVLKGVRVIAVKRSKSDDKPPKDLATVYCEVPTSAAEFWSRISENVEAKIETKY